MPWIDMENETRVAREVFGCDDATVRTHSGAPSQYRVDGTSLGRVELVSCRDGWYVAAAQQPPPGAQPLGKTLGSALDRYLRAKRLTPWRVVPGRDVCEALRNLGRPEAEVDAHPGSNPDPAALLYAVEPPPDVVGPHRGRVAAQLAALIVARRDGDPLPMLTGAVQGTGRHTLAATAARRLDRRPIGLHLRHMFLSRVLVTPDEAVLEAVKTIELADGELLLVSGAELLCLVPLVSRKLILEVLAPLRPVLLFDAWRCTPDRVPGVAALGCPGLANKAEAAQVIEAAHPGLNVAGAALHMAARAAAVPGGGVVPGRLLFLIRLAAALLDRPADDPAPSLSPDEMAPAIQIGVDTWRTDAGQQAESRE